MNPPRVRKIESIDPVYFEVKTPGVHRCCQILGFWQSLFERLDVFQQGFSRFHRRALRCNLLVVVIQEFAPVRSELPAVCDERGIQVTIVATQSVLSLLGWVIKQQLVLTALLKLRPLWAAVVQDDSDRTPHDFTHNERANVSISL